MEDITSFDDRARVLTEMAAHAVDGGLPFLFVVCTGQDRSGGGVSAMKASVVTNGDMQEHLGLFANLAEATAKIAGVPFEALIGYAQAVHSSVVKLGEVGVRQWFPKA